MNSKCRNEPKEFGENILKHAMKLQKIEMSKLIAEKNIQEFHHGMNWLIPRDNGIEDSGLKRTGIEIKVDYERIRNYEINQLFEFIQEFVEKFTSQFSKNMYEEISKSCEQVGNVVNQSMELTNTESFIAMLEKIEFGVNEEGIVELPSLHVGEDYGNMLMNDKEFKSPEFLKKVASIRRRKITEAKINEKKRKNKFKGLNL